MEIFQESTRDVHSTLRRHAKEQTHKYIFLIVIVFIITCRYAPMTMGMRVPGCACRDQRAASVIS